MHRPAYPTPAPGPWEPAPPPVPALRRWSARLLRRLGARLHRTARRLCPAAPLRPPPPMTLPRLEFHAEAGAPEGALYVDGVYVGRLEVRRL